MKRTIGFTTLLLCAVVAALLCASCKNVTDAIGLNKTYTVTVASNIENGVITSNKETFKSGETVNLTISPEIGYEPLLIIASAGSTSVPVRITGNTATFKMPANNVNVNARFQKTSYSVTVSSSISNGNVTANKATAKMGETVTLTANPASGYQFDSWNVTTAESENLTVTSGTFTMPASNVTVSANFTELPPEVYSISVSGGIAKVNGNAVTSAIAGTTITLEANTPATGKEFDCWTSPYILSFANTTSSTTTFTMPARNINVTATYKNINYRINASKPSHGTLSVASSAVYNDLVTITANPDTGYELELLYINGELKSGTGNSRSFRMPANNVTISARFKLIDYQVSIASNISHGNITADKTTARMGDTVTLTITPETGYELESISATGTTLSGNGNTNGSTRTFTMPAANVTITAAFARTHIGTKDSPNALGDIMFNDGTALPKSVWENRDLTDREKTNAIAIVGYETTGNTILVVGLKQEYLSLCSEDSQGYNNTSGFSTYDTRNGYIDSGIDTYEAILNANGSNIITDYGENPDNYPAFKWVFNYLGIPRDHWYIPTISELRAIYSNITVIRAATEKLGRQYSDILAEDKEKDYTSVTIYPNSTTETYFKNLDNGSENSHDKKDMSPVLAIKEIWL